MPSHWYTDNQGRKRRIPDRANKTTFIQASREIDSLLRDKSYSSFVKRLGSAIKDPKVRLLLIKGRQDGLVKDDLVNYHPSRRVASCFTDQTRSPSTLSRKPLWGFSAPAFRKEGYGGLDLNSGVYSGGPRPIV